MKFPFEGWTIDARVMLAALLPTILIAIALAWYFTHTRIDDLDQSLNDRGLVIARLLGPNSEFGVFSGNAVLLKSLADSAATQPDVSGVAVLDASGKVLAVSGVLVHLSDHVPALPDRPQLLRRDRRGLFFGAPIKSVQVVHDELFQGGDVEPPVPPLGMVLVEVSVERFHSVRDRLIRSALVITMGGLVIAIWLARWLARGVTRPIMDLADTVGQIERGNLQARASVPTGGAVKMLEHGINAMAQSMDSARAGLEKRIADATAELQAQKEGAEHARTQMRQFLGAASHDLRQPLQALGLFCRALRRHVADSEGEHLVGRIERATLTLDNTLEALLDINKFDAGVVQATTQDFPLAPLLENLRATFSPTAAERGLRFKVRPSALWCHSDPLLLERIVANLVANALRYTEHGGVVLGCRRAGDEIRIEIWDTGRGIAADKIPLIFREFERGGVQEQKFEERGLGLGLAIVDRLARLLKHRVDCQSTPARGSVFRVHLARARPRFALPAYSASAIDLSCLQGACVAIADDVPEVLEALGALFASLGAEVIAETSGVRLVMALGERQPGLLVTDFRLSESETGLDVIAAVRAHCAREVPALVVSGETDLQLADMLAEHGVPLVKKPVREEDMLAAVAHLLDCGNADAD
ncbi:MAG: response regulator [Rhodocyclaceae bacterium]|nr:response regulator [Rhodocyclaceae bacterium]